MASIPSHMIDEKARIVCRYHPKHKNCVCLAKFNQLKRSTHNNLGLTTREANIKLPSSDCAGAKVMKNWLPFVFGPAFAIDMIPAPVCLSCGIISSSNLGLQWWRIQRECSWVLLVQDRKVQLPWIQSQSLNSGKKQAILTQGQRQSTEFHEKWIYP